LNTERQGIIGTLLRHIEPYRALPVTVYVQVVASLINNMGGISKLFLPLYLRESYGIDYAHIGLMMGAYGVGSLIGSYKGGVLSDHFDGRVLVTLFLMLSGLCLILLGSGLPLWLFVPVLLLGGLADGAFRPVNQRLVLEPCEPSRRPMAQGMLRVAFNLGIAIAGTTGGILAAFGYQWVYIADGIASLLAAGWIIWAYQRYPVVLVNSTATREGQNCAQPGPWRDGAFLRLMFGMLLAISVFDQMFVTLGLFLREHYRLGPEWIGYLFTLNGLMIVCLQIPVSRHVLKWGLQRCAHVGVLLTGAGFLWLNAGNGIVWALLAMMTLTLGELLISPTFSQLIMHRSEGRQRGRYMGIYTAAWSGRSMYAPALGTWAYGAFGGAALWWICLAVVSVAALIQHDALKRILAND